MKKNLILSVLFLLAIFASCSKETTYSITNATGSLIAVRVHEYDDKDKPIKIQEETVLSTSPITFIAHEKAETIKIYITKALSQYGTWINENLWILFGRYPIYHNRWKYHCGQRRALTIKPRKICLSRFYCFSILFDNSILQKQSGFTICKARHEISKTNLSGLFRF